MTRSPQQAFEDHFAAVGTGDLDRIAADYTDDAIHIIHGTVRRTKEGVKDAFAQFFGDLSAAGEVQGFDVFVQSFADDILYTQWSADLGDQRCDGTGTFVFSDGLIRVQTLGYEIKRS